MDYVIPLITLLIGFLGGWCYGYRLSCYDREAMRRREDDLARGATLAAPRS